MPLYEVVREIENQCARKAVRRILKDEANPVLTLAKHGPDSLTVFAESAGMTQKFLFTKI